MLKLIIIPSTRHTDLRSVTDLDKTISLPGLVSSNVFIFCFWKSVTSNTACITASFDPCLMADLSVFLPRTKLNASTMIDFPAPVSPVKTLSPEPISNSRLSIIAKSDMDKNFSIKY